MYNVKSLKAEEFISDEEIKETLEYAEKNKNNIVHPIKINLFIFFTFLL